MTWLSVSASGSDSMDHSILEDLHTLEHNSSSTEKQDFRMNKLVHKKSALFTPVMTANLCQSGAERTAGDRAQLFSSSLSGVIEHELVLLVSFRISSMSRHSSHVSHREGSWTTRILTPCYHDAVQSPSMQDPLVRVAASASSNASQPRVS
jgi:hypothetical protein